VNLRSPGLIEFCYITASVLFIFGLKMLSKPHLARKGNLVSSAGMLLAIVATLLIRDVVSFKWIVAGTIIGSAAGAVGAYAVKMTAMPEMVALFNGFGGLASLLVGWSEYHSNWVLRTHTPENPVLTIVAIFLTLLIGGVTFSGSVVAYAKLAEKITGKPIRFRSQQAVNAVILLLVLAAGVALCAAPGSGLAYPALLFIIALALALGVLSVIPIGGADMPVVISLLNS
jgi:NAD(P) transhydrogenase subunit beta